MESIGCRIRKLRKQMDLTQQGLGDIVGLHGSNIGRVEKGLVLPDADVVLKMSIYFDVTCDYIISGNYAISHNYNNDELTIINLYNQLGYYDKEEILTLLNLKVSRLKGASEKFTESNNNSSEIA